MKLNLVIVLYQIEPLQSIAINSILKLFPILDKKTDDYLLTIYDNGPLNQENQLNQIESNKIHYVHDSRNLGLSVAYNQAYQYSKINHFDWILLFDHDTELSESYLIEFFSVVLNLDERVVAIVPQVCSNNILVSPLSGNSLSPLLEDRPKPGIHNQPITAINSGSFLRVNFLEKINGFTNEFPLDYLDHWLFNQIFTEDMAVFVAKSTLQHDLSILNFESMNYTRYKSILDSESLFYTKYKPSLLKKYKKHLLTQGLKQLIVIKNKKIPFYTLKKYLTL